MTSSPQLAEPRSAPARRRRSEVSSLPRSLQLVGSLGVALVLLPVVALLQRVSWGSLGSTLTEPAVVEAARVSLVVSLAATALATFFGVPLAFMLARGTSRVLALVRTIVLLPMVLPPVVGGTALLFALGRRGLVGQWLDQWFGITLPFTTAGAILAATYVALPFVVTTVENGLHQLDPAEEELAATMGANPRQVALGVSLPLVRGSVLAGAALAWTRAVGEFGATITFAGNSPGRTQTLPMAIWLALESQPEAALAMSVGLLAVSVVLLAALRNVWMPRR